MELITLGIGFLLVGLFVTVVCSRMNDPLDTPPHPQRADVPEDAIRTSRSSSNERERRSARPFSGWKDPTPDAIPVPVVDVDVSGFPGDRAPPRALRSRVVSIEPLGLGIDNDVAGPVGAGVEEIDPVCGDHELPSEQEAGPGAEHQADESVGHALPGHPGHRQLRTFSRRRGRRANRMGDLRAAGAR